MNGKKNSFLDYLESEQFYDRIYGSIFSFCLNNKELMKKKYVVSSINSFLIENNLNVDDEIIEQIIEGIITITKTINNKTGVK